MHNTPSPTPACAHVTVHYAGGAWVCNACAHHIDITDLEAAG